MSKDTLMKWIVILVAVSMLLTAAPGCSAPARQDNTTVNGPGGSTAGSQVSAASEVKGDFIEGDVSGGEAETLNWILAADASSFGYVGYTLESLAGYDNKFNIVLKCLAKDIEISPDGLVYTITIRPDLKWGDGSQVTADDYVYTMKNLMFSSWLNYNYKEDWQEEIDGKNVYITPQVVDTTTFTITRQTVQPEFIYTLYGLTPYPKYIAVKYEGNVDAFTQAKEFNDLSYTGNLGPYKFKEWLKNDKYVVARNPDYFMGRENGGAPFFRDYIVKMFGTSAVMQFALEAGDITYCGIEPQNVAKFKLMDKINVYTVPTTGYNLIAYNQRANGWEGLRNKQVRQAISMAIDKETIVKKIYLGYAESAYSFIPSSSPWYSDDTVLKLGVAPLNSKQKAIEMLKAAGYEYGKNGDQDVLLDKDSKPVKLLLVTTPGSDVVESMSLLIKQELAAVGIDLEVKWVQWPTLLRQYMMNKAPGSSQEPRYNNGPEAVSENAWDMTLMGHNTDPNAPSGSRVFYAADGGLNSFGFFNSDVNTLFKKIRSKDGLNKDDRKKMYAELAGLISDQQPVDFLTYGRGNRGFQKTVQGIEPGINMGYNYYLWHFE
ncbi:MAG: ABC transporter substrate-binding protein [Chloroflexi bacterium]|nr:ABC transporter substrate-binding protein [Chloroflexota bacterium]